MLVRKDSFCPKCGTTIKEEDKKCSRCKQFLTLEDTIMVKKKNIKEEREADIKRKFGKRELIYLLLFGLLIFSIVDSLKSINLPSLEWISGILLIVIIYLISNAEKAAFEEAGNQRVGVAGYLLYLIGLMAIVGFGGVLRIISDVVSVAIYRLPSLLTLNFLLIELLDLTFYIALIIAAYYLWKVKRGARMLAMVVLIFEILVILNELFLVSDSSFDASILIISLLTIMLLYLIFSRRVKNTYSHNIKRHFVIASSNSTIVNVLTFQAIITAVLVVMAISASWEDLAKFQEDKPCIDYCSQYPETKSYYFGSESEGGGLICQCKSEDNQLISSTIFTEKNITSMKDAFDFGKEIKTMSSKNTR